MQAGKGLFAVNFTSGGILHYFTTFVKVLNFSDCGCVVPGRGRLSPEVTNFLLDKVTSCPQNHWGDDLLPNFSDFAGLAPEVTNLLPAKVTSRP